MGGDQNAYYDRYWAPQTAQFAGRLSEGHAQVLAQHIGSTDDVLDIGCGDGRTSGAWAHDHAGSYVGVDVSREAVEHAKGLGLDARTIEDASSLPFDDETFDAVLLIEVLEHLFQPQLAVAEARRVLRPAGTMIVTVPNVGHWRHRADLLLLGRFNPYGDALSLEEPWRDPHIRFFTPRTLERMLDRAGIDVVASTGSSSSIPSSLPGLRRRGMRPAGPVARRLAEARPSLFAERVRIIGRSRAIAS
jgi:methionine biosynthesis protein MetW